MPAHIGSTLRRGMVTLCVLTTVGLAACSSTESAPPKSGEELTQFLLPAEDLTITGIASDREVWSDGDLIQPGMAMLPVVGETNCAEVIQEGLDTRIQTVGAASKVFVSDNDQIATGIYSVDDPEAVPVAHLYSDILAYCPDPIVHEGTGMEYTVDQLTDAGPDVTGMVVESRSRWGEMTTMVVMHQMVGNHAVVVGSMGFTEPTVAAVFDAQVERFTE